MTDIKLGPKDAALVIKEDGQSYLFLPEQENEDEHVSDSAMIVFSLSLALTDPDIMQKIQELSSKTFDDFEKSEKDE